ncbi:DUF2463 domain-containing protein [Encephalitozoon hellem]|uniref:DUF2463 domain-containing protein n=1 Tax=Encephalitozoon hellem TaxID=27973 RepID=A0A9Q9C2G5_ENCHE|nr:DUF2463 domain-containing protein [Encephalitozoon hellem]UTX42685.1 DUF2463 domain-containing protein [Encephalitozoon hellem]UTX42692.1 DUF2463 domain-containing protein [Encephalitozoon hellem]UTX42871.1 DUF2463 domain-containing protein [Encephalitozoon hellem]UTX42878.1 DUF2463 domain-containing protein [Encephalitozoon hellem]
MNLSINLPELDQTDEHTKEHRAALGCWDIIHICAAPISIVLSTIICLLLKEDLIEYNILLRLITISPPFLYSGMHCLALFNKNRKEQCESSSTFHSALRTLLNTLLLLFSVISFLSIIALSIVHEWDEDSDDFLSIVLPPLLTSTYLLNTSCSLTQSNFRYTTTNTTDILLDLLILLFTPALIIIDTVLNIGSKAWIFCFITALPVLILIRSWRERCLPSTKHEESVAVSRTAIPIIILVTAIIAYSLMGILSLSVLNKTSSGPLKA